MYACVHVERERERERERGYTQVDSLTCVPKS